MPAKPRRATVRRRRATRRRSRNPHPRIRWSEVSQEPPLFSGLASRWAARVPASRFAKPGTRVVLIAWGLAGLAAIGRAAVIGSVAMPTTAPAATTSPPTSPGPASPEDPVFLNSAGTDDLRRLRGIGEKRATAILAPRTRLGRLRAIEDRMKVKGIGRATLGRLPPLVRWEEPGDAGR